MRRAQPAAHLNCCQTLLAVPLLDANVDVVLGIRGVSVLVSRIRKRICDAKWRESQPQSGSDKLKEFREYGCDSKIQEKPDLLQVSEIDTHV